MKKRLRKKLAKKKAALEFRGDFSKLGKVISDEIMLTMARPSWLTGTAEEWLAYDNLCHPHWVRTSWGSKPVQGVLQKLSS